MGKTHGLLRKTSQFASDDISSPWSNDCILHYLMASAHDSLPRSKTAILFPSYGLAILSPGAKNKEKTYSSQFPKDQDRDFTLRVVVNVEPVVLVGFVRRRCLGAGKVMGKVVVMYSR